MENLTAGVLPENMTREQLELLAKVLASRGVKVQLPKCRPTTVEISKYGHVTFHDERVRKPGISLYADEWIVLIEKIEMIKKFIQDNAGNNAAISLARGRELSKERKANGF
jgi:hypothetical protein